MGGKAFNGGRISPQEYAFARNQARTGDPQYSAWAAGYGSPEKNGYRLARSPKIQAAVRDEVQRFLFEEAGSVAVGVLTAIATDQRAAVGARVKCAVELARLSNIAITDDLAGKADHEMTLGELEELRRKLEAQRTAVSAVLDRMPRQAIDLKREVDVFA